MSSLTPNFMIIVLGTILCLLLVSTSIGIAMIIEMAERDGLELEGFYAIAAVSLTIIPSTIFIFLTIVVVKVACFHIAKDRTKRVGYG
jgi:hypothetical protein